MNPPSYVILYEIAYAVLWLIALFRSSKRKVFTPIADLLAWHALVLGAVVMLFPFYWMLINSFKPAAEAAHVPPTWWPEAAHFGSLNEFFDRVVANYRDAWNSPPGAMTFSRYFWVSFFTSALATLGVLVTSILGAYAFAKMKFFGRGGFFFLMLATLMIPPQILIVPNYLILERLGWLDSYAALVVPFLASVFAIFLIRQFFMTTPEDLWDAAQLDGASRRVFLWRILVPLARPVLITTAILTFLGQWNALFWPLIATTRPEMRTLMVGLQSFNEESSAEPNLLMAAATISMLPVLAAFFFLQRYFVQSVTRTGIKG